MRHAEMYNSRLNLLKKKIMTSKPGNYYFFYTKRISNKVGSRKVAIKIYMYVPVKLLQDRKHPMRS